jgi:DNA-directed RNA polymerase specialized sigma24 family protein
VREGDAMARRDAEVTTDDKGQFDEAIVWLASKDALSIARRHCEGKNSTIEARDVCQQLVLKLLEKRLKKPGFLGKGHKISNLPAYLNRALFHELVNIYRGSEKEMNFRDRWGKVEFPEDEDRDSRVLDGIAQLLQDYRNKVGFDAMSDEDATIRLIALIRSELELAEIDSPVLASTLAYLVATKHPEVDTTGCPDSNGVRNEDERAMWIAAWIGNRTQCFDESGISPGALRKRRQRFLAKVREALFQAQSRIQLHLWEAENG